MTHGGKRENAGRKMGYRAIQAERAREFLIKRIADELEPIVTAQIEAAKGIYYLDENDNTIYTKKPDLKAGEFLLNQSVGKPKESIEMSGKDGQSIPLNLKLTIDKIYGQD